MQNVKVYELSKRKSEAGINLFSRSELPSAALAIQFLTGRVFPEQSGKKLEIGYSTLWGLAKSKELQMPLFKAPLTLEDLAETFEMIASLEGKGVRKLRESQLQTLFNRASNLERKYLFKILSGEMQIGVVDGLILEALALTMNAELERVRRGFMLVGNVRQFALAFLEDPQSLGALQLQLFKPLKPMLAEMADSISEVLGEHPHGTLFE